MASKEVYSNMVAHPCTFYGSVLGTVPVEWGCLKSLYPHSPHWCCLWYSVAVLCSMVCVCMFESFSVPIANSNSQSWVSGPALQWTQLLSSWVGNAGQEWTMKTTQHTHCMCLAVAEKTNIWYNYYELSHLSNWMLPGGTCMCRATLHSFSPFRVP